MYMVVPDETRLQKKKLLMRRMHSRIVTKQIPNMINHMLHREGHMNSQVYCSLLGFRGHKLLSNFADRKISYYDTDNL